MAGNKELKRNIVINRRLATGHRYIFTLTGIHLRREAGSTTAAEKLDALRHDFGNVPFGPGFVIIAAGPNAAFDVNLPSLGQILAAALGLLAPHDDVVPLGSFLPLTLPVVPLFGCRNREIRHCATRLSKPHFRVFAEIANQDHFIHGHIILHAAGVDSPAERCSQLSAGPP